MANDIEVYKKHILNDKPGENVRDNIILAVKQIGGATANAASLNGVPASEFATKDNEWKIWYGKLEMATKYDTIQDLEGDNGADLASKSMHAMTSGNMHEMIRRYIRPSLRKCMHYQTDPEENSSAKDAVLAYLDTIKDAKDDMRKSLIAKGQNPKNAKSFVDFARMISQIGDENPELVKNQKFDKQQEYNANEDNEDPTKTYAYGKKFEVDVTDVFESKTISSGENNSTVTAPDGKLFKEVHVNISGSTGGSLGSGRTGGLSNAEIEAGEGSTKLFTENGTFLAEEDGVQGWPNISVHVKLPGVGANVSFKVTFKASEEGDILDEVQVPAWGVARYTKDLPEPPSESLIFSGWDPVPCNVISDMTVIAKFKQKGSAVANEITDDWATIIAARGAGYDIGSFKSMELGTLGTHNYGTMIFKKVYEGEDGTTSTWVSDTVIPSSYGEGWGDNWATVPFRNFLQNQFIEELLDDENGSLLVQNVLPVRKKAIGNWSESHKGPGGQDIEDFAGRRRQYVEHTTIDRFWVPSASELFGPIDEALYNQIVEYFLNGYDPQTEDYYRIVPSSDFLRVGGNYPTINSRLETWFSNYCSQGAYSGVTQSIHHHTAEYRYRDIDFTAVNTQDYIKTLCTDGSAVEWWTRTGSGVSGAEQTGFRMDWYGVLANGTISSECNGAGGAPNVPIGFCL